MRCWNRWLHRRIVCCFFALPVPHWKSWNRDCGRNFFPGGRNASRRISVLFSYFAGTDSFSVSIFDLFVNRDGLSAPSYRDNLGGAARPAQAPVKGKGAVAAVLSPPECSRARLLYSVLNMRLRKYDCARLYNRSYTWKYVSVSPRDFEHDRPTDRPSVRLMEWSRRGACGAVAARIHVRYAI